MKNNARRKFLIHRVMNTKRGITIIGTHEYEYITGIDQITFNKCGRRKAEALFIARYISCLAEPMRPADPELAQKMYLASECNWRGYKAIAE